METCTLPPCTAPPETITRRHHLRAVCATDLLVGCVEQQVPLGPPHGQAEAVKDVDGGQEETEEAQLFPTLQPALQPVGEVPVLGAVVQLVGGRQLAGEVDQSQQGDGHRGQRLVHHLDGDLVEVTLLVFHVRVDDVPHEGVGEEEDGDGHGGQDGSLPTGKQLYGHALNVPRGRQGAHVHGVEVELAGQLHNLLPGRQ